MEETSTRKVIISNLSSSNKEQLPIPIPALKKSSLKTQIIDIAMIGTDAYHTTCHLKKAQVFAILIKDLQYQAKKEARVETNPKIIIPKKYHNFLDIFPKKNSDNFFLY